MADRKPHETPEPPERPDWLGDVPSEWSGGWWIVRSPPSTLSLGDIPAGAQLAVLAQRSLIITAASCNKEAVLRVDKGSNSVNLTNTFSRVLVNHSSLLAYVADIPFELDGGGHLVRVGPSEKSSGPKLQIKSARLTIKNAVGITAIQSESNVAIATSLDAPDVKIEGSLSTVGQSTLECAVVGTVGSVNGNFILTGGTNLDAGTVTASALRGAALRCRGTVRVDSIEDSTIEIAENESSVVLSTGPTAVPPTTLEFDESWSPRKKPPTSGTIRASQIRVAGPGSVTTGEVRDASISTDGALTAATVRGASVLEAGAYIHVTDDVTGIHGERVELVSSTVCAGKTTNAEFQTNELVLENAKNVECKDAETIVVRANTAASKFHAQSITLRGPVHESHVTCTANAELSDSTESCISIGGGQVASSDRPIMWAQNDDLVVQAPGTIQATAGDSARELTASAGSRVEIGSAVSTFVKVDAAEPKATKSSALSISLGDKATLEVVGRTTTRVDSFGRDSGVTLRGEHTVMLASCPNSDVLNLSITKETRLEANGAHLKVTGGGILILMPQARISEAVVDATRLQLEEGARIDELRGRFGITYAHGYLSGDPRHPPLLTSISDQLLDGTIQHEGGSLTEVDVTELPFGQLAQLEGLRVFDPSSRPLTRLAKRTVNAVHRGQSDPTEIRDWARWFDELAARTERHILTGTAQSAIEWARQYLHHHRRPRWHPEYWARFLHRLVGYGYRPGQAILTLGAVTAAVSLMSLSADCAERVGPPADLVEQYCVTEGGGTQWSNWPRAWLSVLVAPAKLVRLTDSTSPLPYVAAPWDSVMNVVITLTFLFTVLALRNYLRINPLR